MTVKVSVHFQHGHVIFSYTLEIYHMESHHELRTDILYGFVIEKQLQWIYLRKLIESSCMVYSRPWNSLDSPLIRSTSLVIFEFRNLFLFLEPYFLQILLFHSNIYISKKHGFIYLIMVFIAMYAHTFPSPRWIVLISHVATCTQYEG